MKYYKAVIIGSGQAGTPLSKKLAGAGWKTAIVEKRWVGGTCLNDGCTPTKTMIASARVAHLLRKGKELGIHADNIRVDFPHIIGRKNKIVTAARTGLEKSINNSAIDLYFGDAYFTGEKKLAVKGPGMDAEELTAEYVFINTGTESFIPDIKGLDKVPFLTSTTILDLQELPSHLVIIGGGYIAIENAQMFRRFGSSVTVLETSPRILKKEDEDVSIMIHQVLEEDGITILCNSVTLNVERNGGQSDITVEVNGVLRNLSCSHILVAAGRSPQTATLNLEATGIRIDRNGFVPVNNRMETEMNGIYALGDVNGGPAFTHVSYNDYIIVAGNLLQNANASAEGRLLPYCMFTDPQLGRTGITEYEARSRGIDIKVACLKMSQVARAIETGETTGMMKAIVDTNTKQILGVAIIGTEGGEVMSVLHMAMTCGITYDRIRDMMFAHPLFSESLNNLFMTLDQ